MASKKTITFKGEECKVFKKPLPVELTTEEKLALNDEAGKLDEKIDVLDDKMKASVAEDKKKLKELRAKLKKLHVSMRTGEEEREVEVFEHPVFNKKRVDIYRLDTKEPEKCDERTMRPEEAQTEAKVVADLDEAREKKATKN